jgi:hypothetical protein
MQKALPVFISLALALAAFAEDEVPKTELGVAHIGGLYALSEADYLNEGAATARALGARCLKVALTLDTDNPTSKLYPFHSRWPAVETLAALAETPYFRALFAREFDTFILTAFRPGRPAGYWREGFTAEDEQAEEESFAALTRSLLETYAGTHKTFVLQNWEGDWALRGAFDPHARPTPEATAAMIRWLAARQRGVARARAAFAGGGARVLHACEVNLVRQSMDEAAPGVTVDVLPNLDVDLASYSSWDTANDPAQFSRALAFIAEHKRATAPFGRHGVYVGEFGMPETGHAPEEVVKRVTGLLEAAQKFGCPWAVYWELYCNEPIHVPPVVNGDFKGFWLVRPDGTRSPVCGLFQRPD